MTRRLTGIQEERAAVAFAALDWLGTPYHAGARVRGAGVDCGQLLLAVYAEAGLIPETDVGPYPHDWHLHHAEERYLGWVERWAVPTAVPHVGDVLLFRFGRCIAHGGIVVHTDPVLTIVHAYLGEGVRLEEVTVTSRLWARLVGCWTLRSWTMAERGCVA